VSLHLSIFEGGNALSDFRVQQLLPRLAAIAPQIKALSARFVHLAASEAALNAKQQQTLTALLTYGEPAHAGQDGLALVVTPRFGTVSPWASKATDIAHNCGLGLKRIERITEFRILLKDGLLSKASLSPEQLAQVADVLHDRMTESVMRTRDEALSLFTELHPAPMEHVDVLTGGRAALEDARERVKAALKL
jgi:phosphoribosylformylglycinamidine synthase